VATITGTAFSSWYRQDEGTVFSEAVSVRPSSDTTRVVAISDGSAANSIRFNAASTTHTVVTSNVNEATYSFTLNNNARNNWALAYKANDIGAALNGVAGTNDTSATLPSVNQVEIGRLADGTSSSRLVGTIRRLTYFRARLPNTTLQRLTQ
jgi:hypothetical protein